MQRRYYRRKKDSSGVAFAVVCVLLVISVGLLCIFFAKRASGDTGVTTDVPETQSAVTVVFVPPETLPNTSVAETSVYETEEASTDASTVESTQESTPKSTFDTTAETTTTFTSVSEEEGVRRIENFIFYDTDTPEYRLARLLYCEVPPVVKTAEVTETAAEETTANAPDETRETTVEATSDTSVLTAEDGSIIETTVETYTYEVEGYAALYYKDLTDGEVMVFSPDRVIFGASMIKAVYTFALLQLAERDEIDLEEKTVYTKDMFVEGSGDFKNVKDGTAFTVKELISRTVRRSDNTAFSMLQKRFGNSFFSEIMNEFSLTPTRFGSWWRTSVTNYGAFFTVLHGYLTGENKYGEWFGECLVESLQAVMLQRALRPETVAHKYGWDEDSYCDGAVVLSESPYVLVFMSNLDEGHLKAENTRFIYEVGGIIKQIHDAKHIAEVSEE